MLKLHFRGMQSKDVWLVEPKLTLGNSTKSDVWLEGLSAQHAEILIEHEKLKLRCFPDCEVIINGKIASNAKHTELVAGDILKLGSQELVVVDPKQQPQKPKPILKPKASGWALKSKSSALSNRTFLLGDTTLIGRSNDCDITLATAHLSRRHAQLVLMEGILSVKDLDSSNGTYLNGKSIREVRVNRGDELRFDTLSFEVVGPSDDLDKTTMRPVLESVGQVKPRVNSASKARAVKNAHVENNAESLSSSSRVKGPSDHLAVNSTERKKSSWMGLVLLSVIAAGVFLAYREGLF